MKKFLSMLIICILTIGPVSVFAQDKGASPKSEEGNYIEEKQVMMPIRPVLDAIGSKAQIIWDDNEKSATVLMGRRVSKITVGSDTMVLNGVEIAVETLAEITDGVLFLPLTDLAMLIGLGEDKISWDSETQTVILNYIGD